MSNRGRHRNTKKHLINPTASNTQEGFFWSGTKEGFHYWNTLLVYTLQNHHLYKKWKNEKA